jgi:TolB protein
MNPRLIRNSLTAITMFFGALTIVATSAQTPSPTQQPQQQPAPQQQQEISVTLTGEGGAPPRLAVPDFIPLSPDAETMAIAKTIGQVLWDDLNFEREFALIPRDTYATIPRATSFADVPFARWRELNPDGLIVGTVQKVGNGVRVQVRLFEVITQKQAFGQEYSGSAANPRLYAHTIADEIHQQQRGLVGVARTKIAFDSDRDGERVGGTIQERSAKEVYFSDYDGENQRRLTVYRSLNIMPAWSPDARSIAYISFRRGRGGNIFISNIFQGTQEDLTKDQGENWLPSFSPDGTRVAFSSTRDGNPEIYIANRDGSNVRRITDNRAIDTSPTWSPSGAQIAFVSDRSGSPQIYVIGTDLTGLRKITSEPYCDRPTWSPPPYNEIAFASRTGPGLDIKVMDLATNTVRQLTFGEGSNESPSWSPNGRHLAFSSTRAGKTQIFTMSRDGKNVRQVTRSGNNYEPDWSKK